MAGVEGRLATRISHRPRNFLNEEASVVEYQSLGRDPSSSPVPGTIYFYQSVLHMNVKNELRMKKDSETYTFIGLLRSRRIGSDDRNVECLEQSCSFSTDMSVSLLSAFLPYQYVSLSFSRGPEGLTRNPAVFPYNDLEPIPALFGFPSGWTFLYKSSLDGHFACD